MAKKIVIRKINKKKRKLIEKEEAEKKKLLKEIRKEEKLKKQSIINNEYYYEDETSDYYSQRRKSRKRKRYKRKKKSFIKKLFALIFVLLIGLTSISFICVMNTLSKVNTIAFTNNEEDLGINEYVNEYYKDSSHIINIALFGLDTRLEEEEASRTDTIMIASFNTQTGDIKLVSILRDTYIKISEEGYTYDKINAAYSYGGAELAVKTINENFDMNIENYIAVDFSFIKDTVDLMGGITLDITEEEIYPLNVCIEDNNEIFNEDVSFIENSGTQTLNGSQALAYCRIRYLGNGDFDRVNRQKIVLGEIYSSIKESNNPIDILKLSNNILPSIETSLKGAEMLPLFWTFIKSEQPPESYSIDEEGYVTTGYISNISYVLLNTLKWNVEYLHNIIYDNEYTPSPLVTERSNEQWW